MAMNAGMRSCASKLIASAASISPKSVNRSIHTTTVKKMGGHGHGHDEPYYVHAKHMYNLERMTHQKLKVTLSVLGVVGLGVGIPVYAVMFQQKKTASA